MPRAALVHELAEAHTTKLILWREKASQLATLREEEMALRQELVNELFDAEKAEGSQTLNIGNGWKLEATKVINYRLDKDNLAPLLELLPPDVGEALFRWKPELSVTTYKNSFPIYRNTLPEEKQKQLTEALVAAVTITPGSPTLKLVAPKEK